MSVTAFSRLGSSNAYDNALRNLQSKQTSLANLQENLTSGKKITTPSDDPTGAAQAERAMNRIARIATDQRALEAQRNDIAQAEGTLGDVSDALQNFRELVVSAGNGTHTPAERTTIAGQLSGIREQILSLANTKDSNGMPLFAALGSALAPFVGPQSVAPDYTFSGLPGQSASGPYSIPFTLDGESAFMNQPARDGVFNVTITNPATGLIPADRALNTDNVKVTNNAIVAQTATAMTAYNAGLAPGLPKAEYPDYSVAFSNVVADPVTGMTSVDYTITETPAGITPGFVAGPTTISYKTGDTAKLTIPDPTDPATPPGTAGIPGMTFTITGVPPIADKANGATAAKAVNVVGSPANGDVITIKPKGSVFSVLDSAIQDIGSASNKNAASQAVSQALHNIDISMARVSAIRGQAGDLLGRADRITATNDKRNIEQEANRSRAEDLDMIKGVSDFQNQQTGYSAALQSYAQVQKLSLFNFIG
jgi:flagellar hook-associated protein 3 FlgL